MGDAMNEYCKYPTPADSLNPWEGTPEGDVILSQVLDKNSPIGKPKFHSKQSGEGIVIGKEKKDVSNCTRIHHRRS